MQFEIKLTKNKRLNFGFMDVIGPWTDYFSFNFSWTCNCDHAGLSIGLCIMNFCPYFRIQDIRHWNDENHRWSENG